MFVRLSICCLFIRIFFTKPFKYAIRLTTSCLSRSGYSLTCNGIWRHAPYNLMVSVTVIDAIVICRPFEFNWNRKISGGNCQTM
jgi:hypothetical protein